MPRAFCLIGVAAGHAVVDEPREDVADCGLATLEAPLAGHDATHDGAEDTRDVLVLITGDDPAHRGAHDAGQLAGFDGLDGGGGHVGINIAHGDHAIGGQAKVGCPFLGQVVH
jgi:hypothetical protein